MKIVEINIVDNGSTGKIMLQIADCARQKGFEVYTFSRAWKKKKGNIGNHYFIGSFFENIIHRILGTITGIEGVFTYFGTKKMIRQVKEFSPDIIHLHNLHGWYIHFKSLFKYIKKNNIKVVWTLHDCWAFTGHCPYFDMANCTKWKSNCYGCPQYHKYPKSFFDNSKIMYKLKKSWFCGVESLTIVTPSQWLADLAKESFLSKYPIQVINNGINLNIFKPMASDFRVRYDLVDRFVLLGVTFGWEERKGLDVFIELSRRLDDRFRIVLVGTNENIDKQLPPNIISIHKTDNQIELAKIYSAADVFINPTREENYPTVNMEAIACGVPVITFKTGGSPEMLDSSCGVVVEKNDIDNLEKEIVHLCETESLKKEDCIRKSYEFNMNEKFKEYIALYETLK